MKGSHSSEAGASESKCRTHPLVDFCGFLYSSPDLPRQTVESHNKENLADLGSLGGQKMHVAGTVMRLTLLSDPSRQQQVACALGPWTKDRVVTEQRLL